MVILRRRIRTIPEEALAENMARKLPGADTATDCVSRETKCPFGGRPPIRAGGHPSGADRATLFSWSKGNRNPCHPGTAPIVGADDKRFRQLLPRKPPSGCCRRRSPDLVGRCMTDTVAVPVNCLI